MGQLTIVWKNIWWFVWEFVTWLIWIDVTDAVRVCVAVSICYHFRMCEWEHHGECQVWKGMFGFRVYSLTLPVSSGNRDLTVCTRMAVFPTVFVYWYVCDQPTQTCKRKLEFLQRHIHTLNAFWNPSQPPVLCLYLIKMNCFTEAGK